MTTAVFLLLCFTVLGIVMGDLINETVYCGESLFWELMTYAGVISGVVAVALMTVQIFR